MTGSRKSLTGRLAVVAAAAAAAVAAVAAGPQAAVASPLGSTTVSDVAELASRLEALGGSMTMRVLDTVPANAPAFKSPAVPFTEEERRAGYRAVPSGGAAWDSSEGINLVLLEAGKRVHLPRKAVDEVTKDFDAHHQGAAATTSDETAATTLLETQASTSDWGPVAVADAEAVPRSYVAHLDLRPQRYYATGFLVSGRAVATVAHNLAGFPGGRETAADRRELAKKQVVDGIIVKPGRARSTGQGSSGVSQHNVMEAIVFEKYLEGVGDLDVAVLCLEGGEHAPKHGYFKLLEDPTQAKVRELHKAGTTDELLTGYPNGEQVTGQGEMWEDKCAVTWHDFDDANPYEFATKCSSDQGNSGSPLWFPGKAAGEAYVTGIVMKGTAHAGPKEGHHSYGLNLVGEIASFIKTSAAVCDKLPLTKAEYVKPPQPTPEQNGGGKNNGGGQPLVDPAELEKHRQNGNNNNGGGGGGGGDNGGGKPLVDPKLLEKHGLDGDKEDETDPDLEEMERRLHRQEKESEETLPENQTDKKTKKKARRKKRKGADKRLIP